ncbi:SulP family inorganic anion transporter [Hoeflea prorocentri]|uniref:SulP family inorganic anion transporter n=2 Tax=Hoeflea prorocentri TaxID=1922333 RepID=A0A9X3ZKD4_9HYPH|nr:SulP family inorganic anion transporter [Hoeflea prorocentri]MDA5401590.1 SulP family inorganic anion transporter [Hoeflea prorocentri]
MSGRNFTGWLKSHILAAVLPIDRKRLPAEIIAGITLAALAIPEVMGYTKIAGTPVVTGLYTLLIPAVLFALLGSSRHLVVGADSATAAILASGVAAMAATGSADYVALAGLIAIVVGLLLVAASAIGLGFMADFLSRTVLVGFLTGVGIQVALRALSDLLGFDAPHRGTLMMIRLASQRTFDINFAAIAMAIAVIVVITGGKLMENRTGRAIPAAMLAVIGAIAASWLFDLGSHMPVVGTVPGGVPQFSIPQISLSFALIWQLLPTALAMVVVVLAQSTATARAYADRYGERLDETQDLRALGIANIGAGLSGTFIVNGSPTKTEMVDAAGGRSQLSLLCAALVVLLTLLFLTRPLSYLPEAVLSAVVFLIGLKLIDIDGLREIHRRRRPEFWVAIVTAGVVVAFGVEQGIVFAILFSLVVHTRHGYRPTNLLIVREDSGRWRGKPLDSGAEAAPGLIIYRFNHSMYYANAERMKSEILQLARQARPPLRWLCLDASAVDDVDYTATRTLREISEELAATNVRLAFAQDVDDINEKTRGQLRGLFPDAAFFNSLDDVLAHCLRKSSEPGRPKN